MLMASGCVIEDFVDLSLFKQNYLSLAHLGIADLGNECKPDPKILAEQSAQPIPSQAPTNRVNQSTEECKPQLHTDGDERPHKSTIHQSTQTQSEVSDEVEPAPSDNDGGIAPNLFQDVKVKEEPKPVQVKVEEEDIPEDNFCPASDGSEDDMSLIQFKKKKSPKSPKKNGQVQKKKKKSKIQDWDMLMHALPEGTALTVVDNTTTGVKMEVEVKQERLDDSKDVKSEPVEYNCCICFVQCYSRNEMLHHYK